MFATLNKIKNKQYNIQVFNKFRSLSEEKLLDSFNQWSLTTIFDKQKQSVQFVVFVVSVFVAMVSNGSIL